MRWDGYINGTLRLSAERAPGVRCARRDPLSGCAGPHLSMSLGENATAAAILDEIQTFAHVQGSVRASGVWDGRAGRSASR